MGRQCVAPPPVVRVAFHGQEDIRSPLLEAERPGPDRRLVELHLADLLDVLRGCIQMVAITLTSAAVGTRETVSTVAVTAPAA